MTQLALDPPTCDSTWGRKCVDWGMAHACSRDERHQGPHRCGCGAQAKKAPKKKPKGPTKTQLKKKADELAGAAVRARGYCQAAGKDRFNCGGRITWAHIETRAHLATRWESWAALALCDGHHRLYTNRPTEWTDFLDENFPDEIAQVRAHRMDRFDGDYEALIARLKDLAQSADLARLERG